MERTFKGMLFATAAGAVMLTAVSAEAAYCVKGAANGGTGLDLTCAINSNSNPAGVSYVDLTATDVGSLALLGLVDAEDTGNVLGSALNPGPQPSQDRIAELKLGAGEINSLDQFVPLGKIEIPEDAEDEVDVSDFDPNLSVGDFTLISGDLVTGTFEYTGPGLDILNIALKDGVPAGPAAVYAALDVKTAAQFTYDYEQGALSNAQFSTVPLPAAAWLMIGGLGAVYAVTRRRRSGAAAA